MAEYTAEWAEQNLETCTKPKYVFSRVEFAVFKNHIDRKKHKQTKPGQNPSELLNDSMSAGFWLPPACACFPLASVPLTGRSVHWTM